MPSKTSLDELASFIRQLDAETLASVLIELAAEHSAVHELRIPLIADTHSRLIADSVPGDRGHPG
jgi:hypothetical protein